MTLTPPPIRRRALTILSAALLPACTDLPGSGGTARAQGTAPAGGASAPAKAAPSPGSGGTRPVQLPCANQPGDIVALVLEGSGAPAGTVVVFGQAFRPGAVPRGGGLRARAAGGGPLPAQLDAKTHHPDGSVRFGVVSLAAPGLRTGSLQGVILASGARAGGALDLMSGLAGRQAVLELLPPVSPPPPPPAPTPPAAAPGAKPAAPPPPSPIIPAVTTPWRVDLLAQLRANRGSAWQSGPLASQARLAMPVPPSAVGGVTSLRLVADIALHADGTLWVDAWLRNDIAMRPDGGPLAYGIRITLDGSPALQVAAVTQDQYTGWGRLLGSAPGGKPAATPPWIRIDAPYLAETGAVARYDVSVGVEEAMLARMGAQLSTPTWEVPLNPRGLIPYMPTSGGRPDIGPITQWQAAWLISGGDPRAAAFCLGQAEAAGAVPWHFWDAAGGVDGRGGWMDVKRWPGFWIDRRNGPPPKSLLQSGTSKTWSPDTAHQPDLSFVPYLLTGRRAFLDNLLAHGAYQVIAIWPVKRTPSDLGVIEGNQTRGAAWGLRQLDEAAWASPDDDPNTAYLRAAAAENWRWLVSKIPEWTAKQGEAYGWNDPGGRYPGGGIPTWQQDHFASTVIAAAARGTADAVTYLNWSANWVVGRFLADKKGFHYRDGTAYTIAVSDDATGKNGYTTWAQIQAATIANKQSNIEGPVRGEVVYAVSNLAGIISLGGPAAADARRAYDRLLEASGAPVSLATLLRFPTYSTVPRGGWRIPGNAPRCGG